MNQRAAQKYRADRIATWIGSVPSLVLHTIIFSSFLIASFFNFLPWDTMLLVLTTIVSLEAIYLAIFIQMTVNHQAYELAEVSEDVGVIQEDLEEISEDVEDIQEDIEGISEDDQEELRKKQQAVTLEQLTSDVRRVLADIETLKLSTGLTSKSTIDQVR